MYNTFDGNYARYDKKLQAIEKCSIIIKTSSYIFQLWKLYCNFKVHTIWLKVPLPSHVCFALLRVSLNFNKSIMKLVFTFTRNIEIALNYLNKKNIIISLLMIFHLNLKKNNYYLSNLFIRLFFISKNQLIFLLSIKSNTLIKQ